MKSSLLLFCALWFGLNAMAQTPTAPATPASSTTIPDNSRYTTDMNLLPNCQKQLDAIANQPCDLIFIGDSITQFFPGAAKAIWEKAYGQYHPLDFGIMGDKTQNVLWRLGNMNLKGIKPKVAVILIGTNNVDNTPQEIADGVKAVIGKTQEIFPGVKIILVSIMPNARANDKMMAVDAIIRDYADNTSVFYLDLVPVMTPMKKTYADGTSADTWKGLSKDRLHPDFGGYQLWADAMAPLLTKLMAGQ
jgi:lysophospholipase L1-like esterase